MQHVVIILGRHYWSLQEVKVPIKGLLVTIIKDMIQTMLENAISHKSLDLKLVTSEIHQLMGDQVDF